MASAPQAGFPLEAVVIGGGPAGLTCALYLARFKRQVLLVEDGSSRAARIPLSRNYPGFPEGVAGADLVAAMRQQAHRFGVRFATGRVEALSGSDGAFHVQWADGQADAAKLVVATGVSDVPPDMPYMVQALQEGALRYCPVCDGYEVMGKAVGLMVDSGSDTSEAMYLRHFTPRLTVFRVSRRVQFTDAQQAQLAHAGVTLVADEVNSIRLWDGRVTVRHGEAETIVDSLYCALGIKVHSELAVLLGADHEAGYLLTDRHQQTSVSGLYAAGDVVKGLNQISVGVGQAALAASAIHMALLEQD